MRNSKGQFIKGEHWRQPQPFWEKDRLINEYINKCLSAKKIASEFNVTENAILFWLNKHQIKARTMSEIRSRKYWGILGEKNGMFGKVRESNPNWKNGISQDRQSFYSSLDWKSVVPLVYEKFNYKCDKCDSEHKNGIILCIHHVVSFKIKELRCELKNLVLLCEKCHHFVHSKLNINNEYLMSYEQFNSGQ